MSEPTSFTPGPWQCDKDDFGDGDGLQWTVTPDADHGVLLAIVYGPNLSAPAPNDTDGTAADARLIAAAPSLYEALEVFLVKWQQVLPAIDARFVLAANHGQEYEGPNLAQELEAMRAALALARGES